MKRIPLILLLALLLLLPAIALYPILHASAEKDGVNSSTAIQEAAPSEAAPSEAAPSEAAPSEAALSDSAVAAPPPPSPSVVLSTPMIFPSPTASNRRFTAI